ncbi:MAG TPA: FtsX-like permease family protein, partial [Thermoanaerobaculia bacterium]|nr:FtsX-like permease family protein [Thermoanaerobaculia bacterium]
DADRGDRSLVVQGILRRGVSPEQANAALASLARRWQRQHQGEHPEYQGLSLEVSSLLDAVLREVAPALWALLAAAGLLLLAAAANLGGFLMATLTDRRRELAVRAALGATRRRLTRQIFAEVLVPSLLAGLLGHLLAAGLARWMVGLIPFGYFPAETVVVHDSRSLALALALALTAGCAVALLGSLRIAGSSRRGGTALRCGRGGVSLTQVRLARGLVAAQVAIAVAVASAGAHVVESLRRQQAASLGFAAGDAVTARVALPRDRYQEREERVRLYQQMLRQVAAAPGIRQAALAGGLPLQEGAARAVTVAGAPAEATEALAAVRIQVVEGDYLETLGVPLLGGRAPGPRDRADGRPVVAVSQELARRLGGREAAIGRQLSIDGWGEPVAREVVGVVADHLAAELGGPWQPALFVPLPQAATAPASLAVVARGEAAAPALLDAVRAAVAGVDRQLPLYETQTLGELVRDAAGGRRLAAVVLELLTALAAALAFLGVFGLVSHGVSQRRRELGIRLAVGGAPGDLFLAVLRQASALALAGAVAGLGLALLAERLLRRLVLDLAAREPALLAVVALGALLLALAAALVPALRAASVPPAAALRND